MTAQRRSRPKWVMAALLLMIAGLALIAGWLGSTYRQARSCLDSGQGHIRALEELQAQGLLAQGAAGLVAGAGDHLRGLQADASCLESAARPFLPLARKLSWLPTVGPDVASAPDLLEIAQAMTDGAVVTLDALGPLLSGRPDMVATTAVLEQAGPSLTTAESAFAHAATLRAGIDTERLSPRLSRLVALVDRILPLLQSGARAARLAPSLLGNDGPRTYLILAQNDDERRPTGGWISGVGLVRAEGGKVEVLGFRDSFDVDNLSVPHDLPPESMRRTLWADIWLFRDSNWSPDFPAAAQVAERILERDQGERVNGVIAVDQEALRLLVTALAPLALPSQPEPVTGRNVLATVRGAWAQPRPGLTPMSQVAEWEAHRKDFMPELLAAMLTKVESGDTDTMGLAAAAWQAAQERHILIYVHEPETAALLAAGHWDGALVPLTGDYLQVVDANVGFNKVDPNVPRTIDYQLDVRDAGRPSARAVIHYQNTSPAQVEPCEQGVHWRATYEERMLGCFWNYVRVYVPAGSELLTGEREPLPAGSLLARYRFAPQSDAGPAVEPEDKGTAAFGLFFVLPPAQERDVTLAWQPPATIVREEGNELHYDLFVQKQSGTPGIALRVTLLLPAGSQLLRTTPEPMAVADGSVTFDLHLTADQDVQVVIRQP